MGNYRYILKREWLGAKKKTVNFIMLNPSTADDVFDDATIRRCVGFAKRWGFNAISVTNLFAYRATDPKELRELAQRALVTAIGKENWVHLEREANCASLIVCAWGDNSDGLSSHSDGLTSRASFVISSLRAFDLYCIRLTAKGNPAHPVRERYTEKPVLFHPRLSLRKPS